MTKTISIGVQKGGVGKSTSTAALAESLSADGFKVLAIDLDPQSSLTEIYGIDARNKSMAEILEGRIENLQDIIVTTETGFDLAPAHLWLARVEALIPSMLGPDNLLKNSLNPVAAGYDFILIDCPPSLGKIMVNALTASDYVLVPVQPSIVDLRGLRLFLITIDDIRKHTNRILKTAGIFMTMIDERLNMHQDAIQEIKNAGLPLIDVLIPRAIATAEASQFGCSVVTYKPKSKPALAYRKLAEFVKGLE